jgi:hypothetical protein
VRLLEWTVQCSHYFVPLEKRLLHILYQDCQRFHWVQYQRVQEYIEDRRSNCMQWLCQVSFYK